MAGYAAATRIEHVEIHPGASAVAWASRREPDAEADIAGATVVELVGSGLDAHLRERLTDVRIYFGQLTWYLFNEEGWR
ncbi:MAG TPA: hypothetical protein VH723_05210 [Candidatus Limnocylindrales bacterium]